MFFEDYKFYFILISISSIKNFNKPIEAELNESKQKIDI